MGMLVHIKAIGKCIADGFECFWWCPFCVGRISGKHVFVQTHWTFVFQVAHIKPTILFCYSCWCTKNLLCCVGRYVVVYVEQCNLRSQEAFTLTEELITWTTLCFLRKGITAKTQDSPSPYRTYWKSLQLTEKILLCNLLKKFGLNTLARKPLIAR